MFPYHKQETKYTCGAAVMRMALEFFGIVKSEKQVVRFLGTNKVRGTWLKDFPVVAERFGLNYFVSRNSSLSDLRKFLKDGFVVIVDFYVPKDKVGHFSVVKKIDSKYIYFWDPWFGPEHKYSLSYFKRIWKCDPKYEGYKSWFIALKKS